MRITCLTCTHEIKELTWGDRDRLPPIAVSDEELAAWACTDAVMLLVRLLRQVIPLAAAAQLARMQVIADRTTETAP